VASKSENSPRGQPVKLTAFALFICVAIFALASLKETAHPSLVPSTPENLVSHNNFSPLMGTVHQSDELPYVTGEGVLTTLKGRGEGVSLSSVLVLLDRSNLGTNLPVKIGLFKGLKLIDIGEILGDSCRLSTQRSGTFSIAVDTTTLPDAYGVSSSRWAAGTNWSGWTPFEELEINAGEEALAKLQLLPPGHLTVTALCHEGLPLEQVRLSLSSVDFPAESHTRESVPSGVITFNKLRAGSYILRARAYGSRYDSKHAYRSTRVDVDSGVTSSARIQPEPRSATVSGILTGISGLPVMGASIHLKLDHEATKKIASGPDGRFFFNELHAGEFIIKVPKQELPISGNGPALDIISSLRVGPLQLKFGEHIQLGELAIQLKEEPSLTLHVFGSTPDIQNELSIRHTDQTRSNIRAKPSFTEVEIPGNYKGNQKVGAYRIRRPKAGVEREVYLLHGKSLLGKLLISYDSPAAIDFYL
jgi:hypothetical protein